MDTEPSPVLIPIDELRLLHENICQTLGDPKRIQLLYTLANGALNVNTLAELLDAPQPTISRHLALLRQRGLVRTERDGTTVLYSLATPKIIPIIDSMRDLLREMIAEQMQSLGEPRT